MRLCHLILVLVTVFCASVSSSELVTAVEDGICPPWTYYRNNTCQCGSIGHGIIQCNATSAILTLQMCTCMTYHTNHSVAFSLREELITSAFLSFIALVLYIALFVIAQPYKDAVYNKTDIPLLMALLFGPITLHFSMLYLKNHPTSISDVKGLLFFMLLLYPIIWSVLLIAAGIEKKH